MVFSRHPEGVVALQLPSWQLFRDEFQVEGELAHDGAVVGGDDERVAGKNKSRAKDWEEGLPYLIAVKVSARPEIHYLLHEEAKAIQ
jgi:hypothetical protein